MTLHLKAETEDAGTRLDAFVASRANGLTRSQAARYIDEGRVSVDGKPASKSCRIGGGETVTVDVPEVRETALEPQDIPLDVVYEDEDVIVVNKPSGLVVHPAPGHPDGTLVNALLWHCGDSLSGIGGERRPGIVHRIDKDTTGALLVCKNDTAHRDLAQQLKAHTIKRRYRAIVAGNLKEDEGTVEGPIGRHPIDRKKMAINYKNGKDAVTHYKVLERFGNATYIECRLETGRTHQIRVHMTSLGHPLLGDEIYGSGKNPYHLQGQTLHAMVLGFVHPRTGEYMEFSAPLPEYFLDLLEKLRK